MEPLTRFIQELFAPTQLLTVQGASATVSSSPPRGSRVSTTSSGVSSVAQVWDTVLGLVRRYSKEVVALLLILAAAGATKWILHRQHQRRNMQRLPATTNSHHGKAKHAPFSAVTHEPSHSDPVREPSQQSCSISDVSSARVSPSRHMRTSPALHSEPGSGRPSSSSDKYTESFMRDENGKMFVLHRHGDYVEVWELDEYGQVKTLDASTSYGDAEEHCEELLTHFQREASLTMSPNSSQARTH